MTHTKTIIGGATYFRPNTQVFKGHDSVFGGITSAFTLQSMKNGIITDTPLKPDERLVLTSIHSIKFSKAVHVGDHGTVKVTSEQIGNTNESYKVGGQLTTRSMSTGQQNQSLRMNKAMFTRTTLNNIQTTLMHSAVTLTDEEQNLIQTTAPTIYDMSEIKISPDLGFIEISELLKPLDSAGGAHALHALNHSKTLEQGKTYPKQAISTRAINKMEVGGTLAVNEQFEVFSLATAFNKTTPSTFNITVIGTARKPNQSERRPIIRAEFSMTALTYQDDSGLPAPENNPDNLSYTNNFDHIKKFYPEI